MLHANPAIVVDTYSTHVIYSTAETPAQLIKFNNVNTIIIEFIIQWQIEVNR